MQSNANLERQQQGPTSGQLHSVYPGKANVASDQEWTDGT